MSTVGNRVTTKHYLPENVGTEQFLLVHQYGVVDASTSGGIYIETSLHADELCGMLVIHHLLKLLDVACKHNAIRKPITIVPFANPIGLGQSMFEKHMGRFSLNSGTNFNRGYTDFSSLVINKISVGDLKLHYASADGLTQQQAEEANKEMIRAFVVSETQKKIESSLVSGLSNEEWLKLFLFKMAVSNDIVIDLHCDVEANLHMYTHDACWPALRDLASEMHMETILLSSDSGTMCIDDACNHLWYSLKHQDDSLPVPMGCEATTVELRGQLDVNDDLAYNDALNLFRFLQRRGYVSLPLKHREDDSISFDDIPLEGRVVNMETDIRLAPLREGTPLSGADIIKSPCAGLVIHKKQVGEEVLIGDVVAEIVNIQVKSSISIYLVSITSSLCMWVGYLSDESILVS
jgi:uncharacterized protein